MTRRSRLPAVVAGAVGGLIATGPMSAVLGLGGLLHLLPEQPPRRILEHLLPAGAPAPSRPLAVLAHIGYGAAAGSAFALLPRRARRPAGGLLFGLLLWAAGYEGWVPAIGALPPAHRDRRDRVLTMIAAHAMYGTVLSRTLAGHAGRGGRGRRGATA